MKSYLDLVTISAKVHRKQNRMSVFCIVLAVFLVTAIFGMADMFIRSQILQAKQEDGNWHIALKNISDEDAALIATRPDVEAVSPYGVINYRGELGYTLDEKTAVIGGSSEDYVTKIFADTILEGTFPQTGQEALVTDNARQMLGLKVGDSITITAPDKAQLHLVVSGILENAPNIMSMDSYAVFLNVEGFLAVCREAGYPEASPAEITEGESDGSGMVYFVQFAGGGNIQNKIAGLKEQCHLAEEQISYNNKLLGLLGQGRDSFLLYIYASAAMLFVLVLLASVIMIASSLSSNVAQRTKFFGLVRCIGATPKQVMRLVRREALGWCRLAIPIGIMSGVVIIWGLCAVLRCLAPEYFGAMPALGISVPSIAMGTAVGILTVMLAARSPARKAGRVSPLAAVSGSADNLQPVYRAADTRFFKIDAALGIHHAKAGRKNLILMAGSFALSIILFLSFSVTVEFMRHALTPLQPWTPDISIISPDDTCSVDRALLSELEKNPVVKAAYGRMFAYGVPVTVNGGEVKVDLISYEPRQFRWAEDYLLEGSIDIVQTEVNTGLFVYKPQSSLQAGDVVEIAAGGRPEKIKIAGILSDCPFDSAAGVGTLICSENTFRQITGQSDYTIIDLQLTKRAADEDVYAIHRMAGSGLTFADKRMGNSSTRGIYYCFGLFVYGFLVLIALITVFNVINSIAMSVAARTRQYGVFRAIGLSDRQLARMVASEAGTYAVTGSIAGVALGALCNKALFEMLVSYRWGDSWSIPWSELGVILLIMLFSIIAAVHGPVKKVRGMSIVETIGAQ